MRPEHLIPVTLKEYPRSIRVRLDERETLSLMAGAILMMLGGFFMTLGGGLIVGAVFGGLGAISFIYGLVGLFSYMASVKKHRDSFYEPVRSEVKEKTGVEISNAQLARMWMDGNAKVGKYKAYAQGRQGKFFYVGLY